MRQAFNNIKNMLEKCTKLQYLNTDAIQSTATGASENGEITLISFFSLKLPPSQQRQHVWKRTTGEICHNKTLQSHFNRQGF